MFSKATEYALRATIFIAQKSSITNKLSINQIAKAIDSPPSFTAKILQSLSGDAGVISSVRGPNGGFYMTSKAKKFPVRRILKAMDEDSMLEKCVLGLKKCSEATACPMHEQYKSIKQNLLRMFIHTSIEELAQASENGKVLLNFKSQPK